MRPRTTGPRLLLVEADHGIASLLECFLTEEGYALGFASSLEEAAAAVRAQPYHLVLVDLFRPSLSELVSTIEHFQTVCVPTPVGLLSSWELPPEATRRMRVAFVLPKPFDLDQVLRAVATTAVSSSADLSSTAELPEQPAALPALL